MPGTTHYLRVKAVNHSGLPTAYSEAAPTVTSPTPALPPGPGPSVTASIKIPKDGKKLSGNRVLIMAETSRGSPSSVLFQFKPGAAAVWEDLPAAEANHPNPDAQAPYFVHWDVSGLASGAYGLRAVARDAAGTPDPDPAPITVYVDRVAPDVDERRMARDSVRKAETIERGQRATIQIGDMAGKDTLEGTLPAGTLTSPTDKITILTNPPAVPPPTGRGLMSPGTSG